MLPANPEDRLTVFFGAFLKGGVVEAGVIRPRRSVGVIRSRARRGRSVPQVGLWGMRGCGGAGHRGSLVAALTSWPVHARLLTTSPRTPFTKQQVSVC